LIGIFATALLILALPAITAAADVTVSGTVSGTATPQAPEPGVAECTPTTGTTPADFVCDFDAAGTFTLTGIGSGTYAGTLRLDWSIYTAAQPCAEAVGALTLTTADGTLALVVEDSSRVCETSVATTHDATLQMTVASGTGVFAGASGTLSGTGTMTAADGGYDTALAVTGTISVPPPASTAPSSAPASASPSSAPASAAPSSPTASTAPVGMLPDTAVPGESLLTPLAAVLVVTFVVGLAGTALARRSIGG
jgi:hypothetical protein